jgi:hypothetical protein
MGRVLLHAFVPAELQLDLAELDRRRQRAERQPLPEGSDHPLQGGAHEIRPRDDQGCDREARDLGDDASLKAPLLEQGLHGEGELGSRHGLRREMGLCQVLLQRDSTPNARVTPAHEAHDAVRVERLLVDPGRSGVEATDRQVELSRGQTPVGVAGGRKGPCLQRNAGCAAGESLDEAREHGHLGGVDAGEAEGSRGLGRLEVGRGLEGPANRVEGLMERGPGGQGPRGRHHLAPRPNQDGVVEEVAQPGESPAHGGLAEPDACRGAAHAALGQQGVESDQEIQVDRR